jgi:hypothetical protein
VFGQLLEAAVGAERVAFTGEHPGRVLVFALEGEHPGGIGETAGQILPHHPAQQFAMLLQARNRHLGNTGTGQRAPGQGGADLLVANLHHILVAQVTFPYLRPHIHQLAGVRIHLHLDLLQQRLQIGDRLADRLQHGLDRAQLLALADQPTCSSTCR